MPRKWSWRNVVKQELPRLGAAIHRPSIELAESVGRFETPFEYLRQAFGGFDETRFLLNKVLSGDHDAEAVRDFEIAMMRSCRLDEPHSYTKDIEREYFMSHDAEFTALRRQHYPWIFSSEWAGALVHEPDPEADRMLDHYICEGLAEYGFTTKTRKFKQNYWRCHSSLLSRRVTIEFDKGTYLPSTKMTGDLRVKDLGFGVSLADPFFFSGCVFHMSKADQLAVQMERFFGEYIRIFPHVVAALEAGIAAAGDFLRTTNKRSVS
jgi:hypothetical protein